MKKFILTSLFLLGVCSQNCFGQLKVTSSGHVGVSSNLVESVLSVGGNGNSDFTAQFSPVTGRRAVCIYNVSSTTTYPIALNIDNAIFETDKTIVGMKVHSAPMNGLTSGEINRKVWFLK